MKSSLLLRALSLAAFVLFPCGTIVAQTNITGAIYNGSGGPLSGLYRATGSLVVPVGQTLTIAAGTIIKFNGGGLQFSIDGTLQVNGTSGSPCIFTDIADDSAGGDTNANGPSSGSAAEWRGLVFGSTSGASTLTYADVRYGGSSFYANVELNSANITLSHCTIRNCYTHGMSLNANSNPTVSNCTFTSNGGPAVDLVPIGAVPGFSNNTAAGNTLNSLRITAGSVVSSATINASALMSGGLLFATNVTVAAGTTLTLNAGVIFKFLSGGYEVDVNGVLQTNGTSGSPVIFTDAADDTAGGDTNSNGASTGSAAEWRGIVFYPTSSASSLTYADVRYGGSGFYANLELNSANPTFSHCTVRDCYTHGMSLNTNSNPTVSNCTFTNNGGPAVDLVDISAVPGFSNNVATGNTGNFIRITGGTVASNETITASSMMNGAVILATNVFVNATKTLTLNAGVIFKFNGGGYELDVNGTLVTNGTSGSPVIFTDAADDTAGGDTNSNGASTGSAAEWRGLVFYPTSSQSSLTYAEVRYGGSSFYANLELNSANPTFSHCTIRDCYTHGMSLNNNSHPTVSNCTFANNGGAAAVDLADISAVPGFTNNTASGNGKNCIRVTTATVTSNLGIGAQSIMNGALLVSSTITVAPAGILTIGQGVVIKFEAAYDVVVDGALRLKGTSYEPIVFTSIADDAFGGDTNNNGPSAGGAAQWRGVTFNAGAGVSSAENVIIRYTGSAFIPGLTSSSSNLTLRAVRIDSSYSQGFVLGALAANPVNLVAYGCGNQGIQLTGGSFNLVHATCASNQTGIRREAAWSGTVVNSISYGNTTNFSNFVAGQVDHSDGGFSGGTNINVNPLFVDLASGDLHLQSSSPCVNTGDLLAAYAVQKDFDENSRILDSNLSGIPAADMGAFEYAVWDVAVFGTPTLGSPVTFVVSGQPGTTVYAVGALDGALALAPFGFLLAGAIPYVTVLPISGVVPVGTPFTVTVPTDPGLVGLVGGIQTLTQPTGNTSVGNFTRLWRATVRP